jgi:hypothetical protein
MSPRFFCTILIIAVGFASFGLTAKIREDKTKCPHVKAIRNFDLQEVNNAKTILGQKIGIFKTRTL